ncbi:MULTISPECIES: amidohydrolase family protein [Enterobacteriaceae]|jgi:cytosine/adenosine deaminase-related metal-dependent hydrolase|uniref:amidohydrolase family protein n=1 Tax=Enterobacteriaceae TaxID=543 RepID=UPI00166A93E2|nr:MULTISPECIES: amidohydrolase family protein [Enterobacteriaceae]EHN8904923.1 amidohydrolase family protein [Enterobacter asburiae]HDT5169826.1 amidohydrolase family protein [Enterobacter hormaechei subsp. steigerwaltii]ELI8948340.1 amidohydrolase family protein [Klebsiella oxytoca]MBD0905465.1 amidohydrolase family protein [Klebsiella grimontii]MCW9612211.1 amidohydrolase family protein [Klebsiella michiganensis]
MTNYARNIMNNQTVTPSATLIRGATILSMDENVGNFERGDILITGATITAVGQYLNAEGAHVIDATNMIAMPGMVDSHRHSWEGQLRRINPNATCLDDYSNATHFSFAKYYRPSDIYVGNLLTALGAIDAGITTIIDNSHNSRTAAHSDAAVEALLDAGIRAIHASGAPVSGDWDRAHWPGNWQRLQEKYFRNNPESLVSLAVMAQLEPELWAEARRLGLPIVTEFFGAEMGAELRSLHQQGLLGPDNIFNHCTALPDEGWKILREAGVRVNVCPRSDAHYGIEDGMFAIEAAQRHGITPGLSVDNETSYSTDMFMEMRVAFYLQRVMGMHKRQHCRGTEYSLTMLPAAQLLKAATVDGAYCAGLQDKVGSLTPGKQADLILINAGDINLYPNGNAFGTVVHATERSNIDTVMIGGRIVKQNGMVVGVDRARLHAAIDESREHLFAAAGYKPDMFSETFLPLEQAH